MIGYRRSKGGRAVLDDAFKRNVVLVAVESQTVLLRRACSVGEAEEAIEGDVAAITRERTREWFEDDVHARILVVLFSVAREHDRAVFCERVVDVVVICCQVGHELLYSLCSRCVLIEHYLHKNELLSIAFLQLDNEIT